MDKRLVILVTNDDGIESPGIRALVEAVSRFGQLVVIAPDKPMSGVSHAITMRNPIYVKELPVFNGIPAYSCSGTPVDCVKFAMVNILKGKPDFIVSGINHGSNASINALYSGTVAAAIEGLIEGIPSVAFSLTNWEDTADMSLSKKIVEHIMSRIVKYPLPEGIMLNVNIPDMPEAEFRGIKICKQAKVSWHERFIEEVDSDGNKTFWLTGDFTHDDVRVDTDQWALENNYAAVVPVQIDLTAHEHISHLKNLENI